MPILWRKCKSARLETCIAKQNVHTRPSMDSKRKLHRVRISGRSKIRLNSSISSGANVNLGVRWDSPTTDLVPLQTPLHLQVITSTQSYLSYTYVCTSMCCLSKKILPRSVSSESHCVTAHHVRLTLSNWPVKTCTAHTVHRKHAQRDRSHRLGALINVSAYGLNPPLAPHALSYTFMVFHLILCI